MPKPPPPNEKSTLIAALDDLRRVVRQIENLPPPAGQIAALITSALRDVMDNRWSELRGPTRFQSAADFAASIAAFNRQVADQLRDAAKLLESDAGDFSGATAEGEK